MTALAKKVAWTVTGVYAALLAVVSLLPSGPGPLSGWDASISPTAQNVLHVPAHVVLAVLICLAFEARTFGKVASFGIASGLFGGLLELAQAAVPGRTASLDDALSNVVGAAAGCFLWLGWRKTHGSGVLRQEGANSWGC